MGDILVIPQALLEQSWVLADICAADVILPGQVDAGVRRDSAVHGEKALMLAVLEDAIRCFQEHLRDTRAQPALLASEAERWIREVDYDWLFSFNNVCEDLGINPDALRAALLRWKAKHKEQIASVQQSEEAATVRPRAADRRSDRRLYNQHLRAHSYGNVRLVPKR